MRLCVGLLHICLILVLGSPLTMAQTQPPYSASRDSKSRLVSMGRLVGVLGTIQGSQRTFTLQLVYRYLEPYRAGRRLNFRLRQITRNVELEFHEHVQVRRARLPLAFDEKGRPRKRTPRELQDLKGPGNLPGYAGEFSDLKTGQIVQVHVAREKRPSELNPRWTELGPSKQQADDPLQATTIVILAEPAS